MDKDIYLQTDFNPRSARTIVRCNRMFANVDIPQSVFLDALKMDDG